MDVEKLISEVFIRVPLWNQAHPDHHNRHILNGLWNEVSNELGLKRDAVQKKWKYLRDYFRVENAKKTKPRSGDAGCAEFSSSWPHYEAMKFLLDQMSNRPSSGNLSASPGPIHPSSSSTPVVQVTSRDPDINNEDIFDEDLTQNEDVTRTFRTTGDGVAPHETETDEPRCVLPSRKRKSQSEVIGSALINIEKKKLQYLQSKHSTKPIQQSADEDRSFFESLIPHVKNIRQENKLLFRNEIQQIVQRFAYSTHSTTLSPGGTSQNSPLSFVSPRSGGRYLHQPWGGSSPSTVTSINPVNVDKVNDEDDNDNEYQDYRLLNLG